MFNIIMIHIQTHLSLLELALFSSQKIKAFAQTEDLDNVSHETDNRERIINIVSQLQLKIEAQIDQLQPEDIVEDSLPILKSWFHDLSKFTDAMSTLDAETIEALALQKEETTKEIVTIFKNKEMFKGYNVANKK